MKTHSEWVEEAMKSGKRYITPKIIRDQRKR
jgi:hypothetical protein